MLIIYQRVGEMMSIFMALVSLLFLQARAEVGESKRYQLRTGAKISTVNPTSQLQIQDQLHTQTLKDLQLREQVQQHLRTSIKNYNPGQYTIISQNGKIILQGNVSTQQEAKQIEKEILEVHGVTYVRSSLATKLQD